MKPTKNRVFCRDCERTKMLFETEKKAENFIVFNQEEIKEESGIAPQRSYFCQFCGGWHVTSIKEKIGISKNEKLFEDYLKEKAEQIKRKELAAEVKKKEKVEQIKIASEQIIIRKEEKQNEIKLKFENEIKLLDVNQVVDFFSEKIESLLKEIKHLKERKHLSSLNSIVEKEKLAELHEELQVLYTIRKGNKLKNTSSSAEKLRQKETEEWRLWWDNNNNK